MTIQTTFLKRKDFDISIPEDATMILNISGGKDSMSMARYCIQKYPQNPKVIIYNNTRFEHAGIVPYIHRHFPNIPFVELDSPGLFSVIRKRGNVPGFSCRFCTSSLKIDPAQKWIRNEFKSGLIINCFGFRAEESRSRAKKQPLSINQKLSTHRRTVCNFAPLLSWQTSDVVDFLRGEGIPLFPTYDYLSRLSCRWCFLAGKREHDAIKRNDFETFELIQSLTEEIKSNPLT